MNWSDLSMVNLHSGRDNKWSYTAFRKPHEMWRSNRDLDDPVECLLQIANEIDVATSEEDAFRKSQSVKRGGSSGAARRASGGSRWKIAVRPKPTRPARGKRRR